METTKRNRRSDAELLAELHEREAKILARQATKDAQANPVLAPIVEELDSVNKDLLAAKRGFADKGPQSFSARIAKAEARIVKITEQMEDAEQVIETAKDRKAELRAALAGLTQAIAKGEEVTEETVSSALFA